MQWLLYLIYQNKDALLALPQELKMIIVAGIAITLVSSILSKAWKITKNIIIIGIIYFLLTSIGII